jgi:hypothetical protein
MVNRVTCRSDTQYPERPTSFYYEGQQLVIQSILARWRTHHGLHFRVLSTTDRLFELIYNEGEDQWLIESI